MSSDDLDNAASSVGRGIAGAVNLIDALKNINNVKNSDGAAHSVLGDKAGDYRDLAIGSAAIGLKDYFSDIGVKESLLDSVSLEAVYAAAQMLGIQQGFPAWDVNNNPVHPFSQEDIQQAKELLNTEDGRQALNDKASHYRSGAYDQVNQADNKEDLSKALSSPVMGGVLAGGLNVAFHDKRLDSLVQREVEKERAAKRAAESGGGGGSDSDRYGGFSGQSGREAYGGNASPDHSASDNDSQGQGGSSGDGDHGYPVVLDLDGDGVELVSMDESSAFFDLDGDGFKENVGWVSSDDALLAIDIDGDGTIDKAEEVNFTLHHEDAETDLDGVRLAFDTNHDGVLDDQDEMFESFRVWQDADGDGVADEGELKTLSETGIASIGLEAERDDQEIDGNILHRTTEMTMEDGTTAEVGDTAFLMSDVSYRENEDGTLDFKSRDGTTAKYGTSEDDVIEAGDDGGLVVGGAGDDVLAGGNADDWIIGGVGADTLLGAAGHDNFFFDGQDEVQGGDGFDVAISTDDNGVALDLGDAEIEVAVGGAGDDSFTGSDQADVIVGGDGADKINAGAGDDLIVGEGRDQIDGGEGIDTVLFDTSEDVTFNLSDHDVEVAVGGSGDDVLNTSDGHGGVMSGGDGNDTISGSWNTDVLIGGAGDDKLQGGAGNDTYQFSRGGGSDTISDTYSWDKSDLRSHYIGKGYPAKYVDQYLNTLPSNYTVEFDAGEDTLELGAGIAPDDLLFKMDGDDLVLALKDPENPDANFDELSDNIRIADWSDSNNRIEVLQFASGTALDLKATLDNLGLSSDGSVLDVGAAMAEKLGALANDVGEDGLGLAGAVSDEVLVGTESDDVIAADAGDDTLFGGAGDDLLFGQDGNDVLSGGEGADLLDGGDGDDVLLSDGNDTLLGGDGNDTVRFSNETGVQVDLNQAGIETAAGSVGDDELNAESIDASIYLAGNDGDDTLKSGNGDDEVFGGAGNDVLNSGAGDDLLDGGEGDDTISGGDGNDLFLGSGGSDVLSGDDGEDTVTYDNASEGVALSLVSGGTGGDAAGDEYNGIENAEGSQFDDELFGSEVANTLQAGNGDDILFGGAGNDHLEGGDGNDEYRYERGNGVDLIFDSGSSGYDRNAEIDSADHIAFGDGIKPSDIVVERNGNDIVIGVRQNDNDNRSVSELEDRIVIRDGVKNGNAIERFIFSDGSVAKLNSQTFVVEYDVLRSDAEDGALSDPSVDPITAISQNAGFDGEQTELEDLADPDEIRDKRTQRQNAINSSQNQLAQAAEVMLLASIGVAAGAAVNPALAEEGDRPLGAGDDLPPEQTDEISANGSDGQNSGADDVYAAGDEGSDATNKDDNPDLANQTTGDTGVQNSGVSDPVIGTAGVGAEPFETAGDDTPATAQSSATDGTDSAETASDEDTEVENNDVSEDVEEADDGETENTSAFDDALWKRTQVTGGSGDDILYVDYESQFDWANGGAGKDTLVMNIATPSTFDLAAHSIEAVSGSGSADHLISSGSDEVTLYGNAGNDTLTGGSGDDVLAGGNNADILDGGDGKDTVFYGASSEAVSVNLATGAVSGGEASGDTITNFENVIASAHDDVVTGDMAANVLSGLAGDDTIDGADGDDVIVGGAGADTLSGGAGSDTLDYSASSGAINVDLLTGSGSLGEADGDQVDGFEIVLGSGFADSITGANGNELLDGGSGDDLLLGKDGNDDLIGGAGNDILNGGTGADALDGGTGFDFASYENATSGVSASLATKSGTGGEASGDSYTAIEGLKGSAYADTLVGDEAANSIEGGAGNDHISAGAGNDVVLAGDGDDSIVGDEGADTLNGGDGADVVDYSASTTAILIDLVNGTGSGGLAAGDSLIDIENIIGTGHDDVMTGDDADNVFKGGAGDDTFFGGDGNDTFVVDGDFTDYQLVHGDDGSSTLTGTDGTDILHNVENITIGGNALYGDQNNAPAFFGSKEVTTDEDATTLISKASLLSGFYDLEGDSFELTAVSGASHGSVSIVGDDIRFVPDANYHGDAGFTYTVTDADGNARDQYVDLTINSVNDAPTAYLSGNRMVASDVDGDALSYSIVSRSGGTSASIDGNGNFSYSASGYGSFSFTMRASDGNGAYVDKGFSFSRQAPPPPDNGNNGGSSGENGGNGPGGGDGVGGGGSSSGGGGGFGGDAGCFVAGTPVLMADGRTKPVEDVEVGDMVMAFDGFGELVPRAVLNLIRAQGKEIVEVNGVKSTFNHPFLTEEGHFKVAAQLSMFDRLVNAEGQLVRIDSIVNRGERANVFNFEVEEHHTYIAGGYRVHNWKPVIVDLNGNGVEFMGASVSTARFDVNGDGNLERTAWVASNDGLLVFDHDQDGQITSVDEVALSMYGEDGATDLEGLAQGFDSNSDGVFDDRDDDWSRFAVWQDVNSDGISDEGEVKTLDEIGISSVNLTKNAETYNQDGVEVFGYGSFTWDDGTTGELADTAFESNSGEFWDLGNSDTETTISTDAVTTETSSGNQMADLLVMYAAGGYQPEPVASSEPLNEDVAEDDYLSLITASG